MCVCLTVHTFSIQVYSVLWPWCVDTEHNICFVTVVEHASPCLWFPVVSHRIWDHFSLSPLPSLAPWNITGPYSQCLISADLLGALPPRTSGLGKLWNCQRILVAAFPTSKTTTTPLATTVPSSSSTATMKSGSLLSNQVCVCASLCLCAHAHACVNGHVPIFNRCQFFLIFLPGMVMNSFVRFFIFCTGFCYSWFHCNTVQPFGAHKMKNHIPVTLWISCFEDERSEGTHPTRIV